MSCLDTYNSARMDTLPTGGGVVAVVSPHYCRLLDRHHDPLCNHISGRCDPSTSRVIATDPLAKDALLASIPSALYTFTAYSRHDIRKVVASRDPPAYVKTRTFTGRIPSYSPC